MSHYKVSVIMAVYNVEPFLREAIDSVIRQDIGFEQIQLILVNDGSSDGSGAICDEYAAAYPHNILVIHKENGGVSSARNAGLDRAEGELINFLDSDDKLTPNTVRRVCEFFEEYADQTDLVTIPLHFFDGQRGEHPLNAKFGQGTRLIDLTKEWHWAQLSSSCAFIKAQAIRPFRFDPNLAYAEDAQVVLKILNKKKTMGVVKGPRYLYRKRSSGEASAVQSSGKTLQWYFPYLEYFTEHMIKYCLEEDGEVPLFVQNTLMYDLQWRFRQAHIPKELLNEEEAKNYTDRLRSLVTYFRDEVVLAQNSLSVEQKLFILQLMHPQVDEKAVYHAADRNYLLFFNESVLYSFERFQTKINFIKLFPDRVEVEGSHLVLKTALGEPRIWVVANRSRILAEYTDYDDVVYSVDMPIAVRKGFRAVIPLEENGISVHFEVDYGKFSFTAKNLIMGKHCPISYKLKSSYFYQNGHILYPTKTGFRVECGDARKARKAEIALLKELINKKDKAAKKAVVSRILVKLLRPFVPRNIWLITDKADRADDNGEAFFLYCMEHGRKAGCTPVFAISKNSPDYRRMKKHGPVIPYMSRWYKLAHLLARHTISAYSHDEVSSPFLEYSHYYCDMLQSNKVVFLQHGIIKDDLSNGLNKNHKNFSLFVTSTQAEYDSILNCNYGYSAKEVILTGLPRYDRLYDNGQRIITVMPTWRRSLFGTYNPQTSQWNLLPGFEKSDFYRFYTDLLNSEKLHDAAKKYGYQLQFLIHPTLFAYLDRFYIDNRVRILHSDAVYRDVFAESALIVTDYSSVAFDFGYLRKPVLYAHFDTNHYDEGYFNYESDGFGEVEYTLEDTVDRLVEYMERGCALKPQYRQRIDSFFAFDDRNNCRRVFEKIMELDSDG